MDILAAICNFRLGHPLDLPGLAAEALSEDIDTPSLRILAGEDSRTPGLGLLFEQVIRELGCSHVDVEYAAFFLSCRIAGEILSGQTGEYEGAREIQKIYDDWNPEEADRVEYLWPFKAAASRIEDYEFAMREGSASYARQIDEEKKGICDEARRLVAVNRNPGD